LKAIHIRELTRIEGHGELILKIRNGILEDVEFRVLETPRLFEAILVGREVSEVPYLVSRICGLCGYAHALCSVKALENALNIDVSEEVEILREFIAMMSTISSHMIHIYILTLADFMKAENFINALNLKRELIMKALAIKREVDKLLIKLCGDNIHPINISIGGFTSEITREELKEIRENIRSIMPTIDEIAQETSTILKVEEDVDREGTYATMISNEYTFYTGNNIATPDKVISVDAFTREVIEEVDENSSSKRALINHKNFMVGALARLNMKHKKLSEKARMILNELNIKLPTLDPRKIPLAQLIEIIHCFEKAIDYLDRLLMHNNMNWKSSVKRNTGRGRAVIEAPRGILYHEYEIENGLIKFSNIVTPTVQNIPDIEHSIKTIIGKRNLNISEIKSESEFIVRCYDPCLSCSTHVISL